MPTTDNGIFTLTANADGVGTETLAFDPGSTNDFLYGLTGTSGMASGTPAPGSNITSPGGAISFSNITEIDIPAAAGLSDGKVLVGGQTLPSGSGLNVGVEMLVDGTALILGGTQLLGGLDPAGTGTVQINGGLELASATGSGNTIQFIGNTDYLTIDHAALFGTGQGTANYAGDVIAQFVYGDVIDLPDVPFSSASIKSFNASTGLLQIASGSQAADLLFTPASITQPFVLSADAMGGTILALAGIACYAHGTRIRTPGGEVEVECLAIGDLVMTASGLPKPIKWIGRRGYAGRFLAANPKVQPILIRKGALRGGLPRRDLMVSPEHALLLDGVLVPAKLLLNGRSIVRASLPEVHYVHLEFDGHDIIYAEGVEAETFIDDDSRGMFHNAAEFDEMYPNAEPPTGYCAPRLEGGYQLEAIRDRINQNRPRRKAA